METPGPHDLSLLIKSKAAALGFEACGISRAECLREDDARIRQWLELGYQGDMDYLERNREKRANPAELMEGARSVISVLLNYYPEREIPAGNTYRIAKYAYGRDYHELIRDKLKKLIAAVKAVAGECHARAFTDSAPVFDKAWAEKSGLGWIGKNTCLIHPKMGSFVFIGEIITDLELEHDTTRINDLCGGCTRCIDACPTGAIVAPRLLDARKCISYLTIEYRGELPEQYREQFNNWIFGCDICQDVCPWNRKSVPTKEAGFAPSEKLAAMTKEKWAGLTRETFEELFRGSAVQRTKFDGLKRNILFLENHD